ncbi:MAG: hypothetical protein RSE18_00155 [Acinetobacter sp.]
MKHYISIDDGSVHGFDANADVDALIDLDRFRIMAEIEVDKHYFPEKYYTDEEAASVARTWMPILSPKDFDLKLYRHGLYDQVQTLVADDFEMMIAYTRASFFSRTDPFIAQAQKALNLTDEQIDKMWLQA